MGAEAEAKKQTMANGTVGSDAGVAAKISMGLDAALKPAAAKSGGRGGGGKEVPSDRGMTDDEIAATLAAASEKLQAAQRRDERKRRKKKGAVAGCLSALYPKKFFAKLRDYYINTCVMAAEKGDFVDLVAGHHAYYGETVMSRNISQRRDREHEEMLNASLSRQVSISLSRQMSQSKQPPDAGAFMMTRNTSNGIPGLSRNASTTGIPGGLSRNASTGILGLSRQPSSGMAGLSRQPSTGLPGLNRHHTGSARNTFGRSASSKKKVESNLFAAGRDTFLQKVDVTSTLQAGQDKVHQRKSS